MVMHVTRHVICHVIPTSSNLIIFLQSSSSDQPHSVNLVSLILIKPTIESARPVCSPAGQAVRPASKPFRTYIYLLRIVVMCVL